MFNLDERIVAIMRSKEIIVDRELCYMNPVCLEILFLIK